jgi:hypothetical protein
MAIETIPKITATSAGGGVVYSIDFQKTFSNEPSKVTYKVVNSSGSYSLPTLESDASISFGDFSFNGYVYSYELEESNSGNVLSITLIDKSVILDKLYVSVFRRGLMGFNGTKKTLNVPVKFDSDDEFYVIQNINGVFKPVKKNYTNGTVARSVYGGSTKRGDIIIVGTEETPDTNCEIPSSSYTFNELKSVTGVSGFSSCPINNSAIRKTYEGTLRSVLNSWCQDFGYSFYWDYSANTLKFFDSKNAVFSIPSYISHTKITSKKTFASAEGKYNQVAVDYFAKPYNPKTASASLSKTFYTTTEMNCYSLSSFIDRSLTGDEDSIYGGGRSKNEFITSAALGYVSPALRKIYNYSWISKWAGNIGFSGSLTPLSVASVAVALKESGNSEIVNDMVSYSGYAEANLDGAYYALIVKYDEGTEDAWANSEQEIFTSKIGNYYRCPYNKSGGSTFCTPRMIVKTSINFEPEGDMMEDNDNPLDTKLIGRRVFSRGGPGPEISGAKALEQLGLTDKNSSAGLQKLLPVQIELLSGSKLDLALKNQGVGGSGDTLFLIPTSGLVSTKLGFGASYIGGSNKKETTWIDIKNSQQGEEEECTLQDPNENKCLSQKDELKQKQRKAQEATQNFETKKPFSGLTSKASCVGASIRTSGGSVKILSSSQSQYRCVVTHSYSVEAILDISEAESIISNTSGSTSSSPKIIETRLIVENRTTSEKLSAQNPPTPSELASRNGYIQSSNINKVTYSCAGFVPSLPTSVSSGLEALDMSISDSGFSATYSYSTRPPVFPSQDLNRINNGSNSSSPAFQVR